MLEKTLEPSKLDTYIRNEAQGQFSDDKRTQIYREKLGYNKMSKTLQFEYDKAIEDTKGKLLSILKCLWCGGPVITRDVRSGKVPLCLNCEPGRPAIERRINRAGGGISILPGDAVKIANSRTTRVGPFGSPGNNYLKQQ